MYMYKHIFSYHKFHPYNLERSRNNIFNDKANAVLKSKYEGHQGILSCLLGWIIMFQDHPANH